MRMAGDRYIPFFPTPLKDGKKRRSYLMVAVFAIMVIFVALMTLFGKVLNTIVINVALISSLLIIMALIILGVSYYISIKIYKKKGLKLCLNLFLVLKLKKIRIMLFGVIYSWMMKQESNISILMDIYLLVIN